MLLVTAMAVLAPGGARAHEVLHQVERSRAVALQAYFADGEVLAYARYEVYSPADPKIPHQRGRTDRDGWLAFVPAVPGTWRVKVINDTGHGLDVGVEVPSTPAGATAAGRSSAAVPGVAAFVLRPLVGVAAIAAVFGVLLVVHRRQGTTR